jgi:hypothetical protein
VLSVLGVVFPLKRRIALSWTGESCMGLSPLFFRMSFIDLIKNKTIICFVVVEYFYNALSSPEL